MVDVRTPTFKHVQLDVLKGPVVVVKGSEAGNWALDNAGTRNKIHSKYKDILISTSSPKLSHPLKHKASL